VSGVRLWLSVFEAPAYPAPARLDRVDIAIIGELDAAGLRTALGALAADRIAVSPAAAQGVDLSGASLSVMRDDVPPPQPIAATAVPTGWQLAEPLAGDPVYLVATPRGAAPWLVASRSHRGY
jgi:hypothetical protein